jgi:hypothetical protein
MKQIILTERHWKALEDDVSDRVWAVFGTAVHSLLEQEGENDFTEQYMSYKTGGVAITGRIDNYDMKNGVICDYKTAPVIKIELQDFTDWHLQGMIYAWLLRKNGFKAETCRFIVLLKDHSKTKASRDSSYPQKPVYVYEFSVAKTDMENIEGFITDKAAEYAAYRELADDAVPACSPAERWERPSKYAVKKDGRKTAVRLFDNLEEAEKMSGELGKGHFVEIRTGAPVKCQGYCLCREFCDYYRDAVNPLPAAETA